MTQPIYDGTGPVPISASQLSTFVSCRRIWAYEKLDGIERPETGATNEGTAIHAEVEEYFRSGAAPVRPEAKALLGLCPPRAEHLIPEAEFTLVWPGEDALLRGKIDLVDPLGHVIYDHKTTSNIDRYAKSEDELRLDAQTVLYGLAYRARFHNVDEVTLQWNYVKREQPKTRPPQTRPVSLTQTLGMLEAGLRHWRPVVTDLVQIAKRRPKADDVEASPGDACFKYGGCHFRDRCADYAGNRKAKETPPMNPAVLARLAALGASTPAPLPDPVHTPAPEPEARPIATSVTPPSTPPNMPLLDSVRIALDIAPEVVPPDAQPDVSPNDPPPPPLVEVKRGRGRPKGSTTKTDPVKQMADSLRAAAADAETRVVPDLDLVAVVRSTIEAAQGGSLDQRLKAAELALGLMGVTR